MPKAKRDGGASGRPATFGQRMTRALWLLVPDEVMAEIDRRVAAERRDNPSRRVSRADVVRELIMRALA